MRPQVGQLINNKYRLLRLIGDGGMGSVYEARHEVLGTTVALKFLHPELSRRSGLVQRFLQEARVSAQIQSPHVVRVTDVDQTNNGLAFIVLEYLEGRTLQTLYEDLYREGRRLSYADALEYAMQMIEGVEAAHRAGVVHRDLKPDNVMITKSAKGEPLLKLLDFGIAKLKVTGELDRGLTRPGVIMGTPEYMAPEQAYSADAVDARADIFSLGVMIFEMLAGRRPVGGDDPQQIAGSYLSGQIAKLADLVPGIAPELAAAVHHAMAPLPKDRFASVSEFGAALEPFARAVRPTMQSNAGATPPPSTAAAAATPSPAAGASPPITNFDGDGQRSVPKTIPPEEQGPPPAMDGFAPGRPTPVGGFGPTPIDPWAPTGPAPAAGLAPTESNPPYQPQASQPTPDRTSFAAPLELSPRPSGTAIAANAYGGSPGAGSTAYGNPQPYGGYGPGTAPMDHGYGPPPVVPGGYPQTSPQPGQRRKGGGGTPMGLILLLATGVAGLVVGGVYLSQSLTKGNEQGDVPAPITVPPTTTVASEPPANTNTQPPVSLPPVVVTPVPISRPTTTTPTTKPTTTTTSPTTQPSSQPTNQPPIIPSTLPPWIPTNIPTIPGFPPFQSPGQSQPAPGGGSEPSPGGGTQPSPTPTTPGGGTSPSPQPSGGIIIRPRR